MELRYFYVPVYLSGSWSACYVRNCLCELDNHQMGNKGRCLVSLTVGMAGDAVGHIVVLDLMMLLCHLSRIMSVTVGTNVSVQTAWVAGAAIPVGTLVIDRKAMA